MDKSFTSDFFISNRRQLLSETKAVLIVITANGLVQKSGDTAYPFKQDTNFWYLCGVNEPDVVLVLSQTEEYLIVPKLNAMRQVFDGAINESEIAQTSGISQLLDEKAGWQKLKDLLERNNQVGTLMPNPSRIKHYDFYAQPARRHLVDKLKRLKAGLTFEDLRPTLARARMVKQPIEIAAIKKAIAITNDTLAEVLASSRLKGFQYAYQLEAAITEGFRSRGAQGHGFEPIVASGKSATVIHYLKNDQPLKDGQLIVIDVGSGYSFYSADITRTVSYSEPSSRQVDVFNAVKQVQTQAIALIKPGLNTKAFEKQVEKLIGQQLIKLGLIKTLDHKAIRHYYPHACSHSLGLDLHDTADYSRPLPLNMVMTVEPGIYIPEESIGVRIEDDVLITKGGCQVLSSSLPTSLRLG